MLKRSGAPAAVANLVTITEEPGTQNVNWANADGGTGGTALTDANDADGVGTAINDADTESQADTHTELMAEECPSLAPPMLPGLDDEVIGWAHDNGWGIVRADGSEWLNLTLDDVFRATKIMIRR